MTEIDVVNETIRLAFQAKQNQYRDDPHFRLSSAGPLTWLHRVPGWFEVDAFYSRNIPPCEVIAAVQVCHPHRHHMVSILAGPTLPGGMTEEYARLGYKRLPELPQPLMRRRLSGVAPSAPTHEVDREEIGEGKCRYSIKQGQTAVSTAEVVQVDPSTIYVFAMQTQPEYRRLGLATALLTHIHTQADKNGVTQSILWSSPMGLPLYTSLGYEAVVTGHGFIRDVTNDGLS